MPGESVTLSHARWSSRSSSGRRNESKEGTGRKEDTRRNDVEERTRGRDRKGGMEKRTREKIVRTARERRRRKESSPEANLTVPARKSMHSEQARSTQISALHSSSSHSSLDVFTSAGESRRIARTKSRILAPRLRSSRCTESSTKVHIYFT